MKLPNGHRAVVELEKLRDYCLSSTHPRGRHKARVFVSRLGLTGADAALVRVALLNAARNREGAIEGRADRFGTRYLLDFEVDGPKGRATVRSVWMVRAGEDSPRFTTCYVL